MILVSSLIWTTWAYEKNCTIHSSAVHVYHYCCNPGDCNDAQMRQMWRCQLNRRRIIQSEYVYEPCGEYGITRARTL